MCSYNTHQHDIHVKSCPGGHAHIKASCVISKVFEPMFNNHLLSKGMLYTGLTLVHAHVHYVIQSNLVV